MYLAKQNVRLELFSKELSTLQNFGHFYFIHQISSLLEPSDVTNMINRLTEHRKKIKGKKTDEKEKSTIIDIEVNSKGVDYNMNNTSNKATQTHSLMIASEV